MSHCIRSSHCAGLRKRRLRPARGAERLVAQRLQGGADGGEQRILPGALRNDLPAIDNSWGAYGAEQDTGSTPVPTSGEGPSYIEQAYARWQGLGADERSPLGQAAILRANIDAITAVLLFSSPVL